MKWKIFKMKRKNLIIVIIALCVLILTGEALLLLHVFGKGERERKASESGGKEKTNEKRYEVPREKQIRFDYLTYTFTRDKNGNVITVEIYQEPHYEPGYGGPGVMVEEADVFIDYTYDAEGNFLNYAVRGQKPLEELDQGLFYAMIEGSVKVENGLVSKGYFLVGFDAPFGILTGDVKVDCERASDGRVLKTIRYNDDGTIACVSRFVYTLSGNMEYAEAEWPEGKKLRVYFELDSLEMPVRMSASYEDFTKASEIRWKYTDFFGAERLTEAFREDEKEPYAEIKYEMVSVPERFLTEDEKEELGLPFDVALKSNTDVIKDPEKWCPFDRRGIIW